MLRQSVVRSSRLAWTARPLSTSARAMAEGDVGGSSGSAQQGDAFHKREKAAEDMYVREQELSKLKALREKLTQQGKNIEDLVKNIDDMTQSSKK